MDLMMFWHVVKFQGQFSVYIFLLFSGVKPPSRWIVNFENDFVDGLVLASLISAYAPYLVGSNSAENFILWSSFDIGFISM